MATYCYKDIIVVENYYNYDKNKQSLKIDKLDIYKIYKNVNIFQNMDSLKLDDLEEYFPLFKLLKIDVNKWKDIKYDFNISNLLLKDFDIDIITIIQNQFVKYILKIWETVKNNDGKCLLLLILIDFFSRSINVINKNFMNILIDKLVINKKSILNLGIIDENKFNKFLNLKIISNNKN
jgi:hypothetical protein